MSNKQLKVKAMKAARLTLVLQPKRVVDYTPEYVFYGCIVGAAAFMALMMYIY